MNKFQMWLAWNYIKRKQKGGDKMFNLVALALGFIVKNVALIVGILEAAVKVIGGIVSLTPTKRDDKFLPVIDNIFSAVKKVLYGASDYLAGKL